MDDCTACPLFERCLARPGGKNPPKRRTLSFPVEGSGKSPTAAVRDKVDCPAARATYALRQGFIEPPFANIRYCNGLDRFHYRGLAKVHGQWLLYCLVHNIGKIARYAESYKGKEKNGGNAPETAPQTPVRDLSPTDGHHTVQFPPEEKSPLYLAAAA